MPDVLREFVPFRFRVRLYREDDQHVICGGAFSEASGFELNMEPKVIAEGGRNWGELQRSGPTKFAPIILKRGVTDVNDLWSWFDVTTRQHNYGYRLSGTIEVLGHPAGSPAAGGEAQSGQGETPVLIWRLTGVLPTKFKGPDLSSTANQVAIEELHLVHEGLELERPGSGATRSE